MAQRYVVDHSRVWNTADAGDDSGCVILDRVTGEAFIVIGSHEQRVAILSALNEAARADVHAS